MMGAIYGTAIRIKPPSTNEKAYVGSKEGHSINCQVICDINEKFVGLGAPTTHQFGS